MTEIRVRAARPDDPEDVAFLTAMAARLETAAPAWIPAGALAAAVERSVLGALRARREGETILLAEESGKRRLGFIYAVTSRDNLGNEPRGYISELAVAPEAEGGGVARRLIEAVEEWSRDQGQRAITLHVFCSNTRARSVYEHLGYEPNVLELRKPL